MISTAADLKYTKEIKKILGDQLVSPSDTFVRFFASQVYSGKITQSVREQFTDIVKRAFHQFISEKINDRLKSALAQESETTTDTDNYSNETEADIKGKETKREDRINTTEEELEGYHIVKAILRETVIPSRIAYRDTIGYMGILLDDNNRKPICRLYFNSEANKYVGFFNEKKEEEKMQINDLNDIYKHADKLKVAIDYHENSQ